MPQDCPDYSQTDAEEQIRKQDELAEEQRRKRIRETSLEHLPCTCEGSTSGLDIDMCPRHGIML